MDSINKLQDEKNYKDLNGPEAGKKIRELAGKNNTCFFSTQFRTGQAPHVRPMAVQKMDDEGTLWFLSSDDSYKNQELEKDSMAQLLFQGSAHSDFLSLTGTATISKDKNKIRELWEPIMKTWFTEGEDDPRITVIRFETSEGYYWDTKHGKGIAFLKMAAGALTGKTMDDSIEGKLRP